MCNSLIHNEHKVIHSVSQMIVNRDPTQTTVLRNTFVRDMNRRFNELRRVVDQSIIVEDVFGMRDDITVTILQEMSTPGRRAFAFPRDSRKVAAFMDWLRRQVRAGILDVGEIAQIGESVESAWMNKYIFSSYKRGVAKARAELKKAGFDVPSITEAGGIGVVLASPIHLDRLGLLYTRAFSELEGITSSMEVQISRILTQGLAEGLGPRALARAVDSAIVKIKGELGLDISYTRINPRTGVPVQVQYYMPARRRAEILSRTEIIRAHAQGTLQEYKNWGVVGVQVKAEFVTAGDDRVCFECSSKEGNTYSIDEAWGIIPVHAQCRCTWIPVLR